MAVKQKNPHTIFSNKLENAVFEPFMDSASQYFGKDSHFIRMKESEKTFHDFVKMASFRFHFQHCTSESKNLVPRWL